MIEQASGDLLKADVDALVNTVNTVGVMGKGIALQFKRAYPDLFASYKRACKAGEVEIGRMMVWPTGAFSNPRYIINFPTKRHWRSPSLLGDVEAGLVDLVRVIKEYEITSIAVPPLGAGNGGLPWSAVKPRIVEALGDIPGLRVLLYEPLGAPPAQKMTRATPPRPLTVNRAALVSVVGRYLTTAFDTSPIEVQKLMYFLQEAGQPLRLRFERGTYGPYADNLRHVLIETEGVYTIGYGDGTARSTDSSFSLLPGAWESAEKVLSQDANTRKRIDRVIDLTEGFDSMYGLELLGTVHWLVRREGASSDDPAAVAQKVASWNTRKAELFTEPHVKAALIQLNDQGWFA
ncbi:MAG: macro domain-containing protein [Propionibacteriaceae bacterium]|jgi:O-acetyl-ADP-ribose deacetylase (regulator of RNase III)|nr:macro domain-containing protein [Propionibacteriaceae bacterium]